MNNLRVGRCYNRNGKIYKLKNKVNLISSDGDKIIYFFTQEDNENCVAFSEDKFINEFIPCKLEAGDNVIAICMGKIIGNFVVASVDEHDNALLSYSLKNENMLTKGVITLNANIPNNCILKPINQPTNLSRLNCLEYIFVTCKTDKKLKNLELLGCLSSEIQKIMKSIQFVKNNKLDNLDPNDIQDTINRILSIREKFDNYGRK